jgi:hypothetical protein
MERRVKGPHLCSYSLEELFVCNTCPHTHCYDRGSQLHAGSAAGDEVVGGLEFGAGTECCPQKVVDRKVAC